MKVWHKSQENTHPPQATNLYEGRGFSSLSTSRVSGSRKPSGAQTRAAFHLRKPVRCPSEAGKREGRGGSTRVTRLCEWDA